MNHFKKSPKKAENWEEQNKLRETKNKFCDVRFKTKHINNHMKYKCSKHFSQIQ
jgi:hypothetical protein